jgi:integrase
MPRLKLTDAAVQRIKLPSPTERQVDYWDLLTPGFGLRISFGGTRTWMVQTRVLRQGTWKQTRRVLGRYPDMSLADARSAAREAMTLVANGDDPKNMVKAKRERLEGDSRNTFSAMVLDFMTKYVQRKGLAPSTAADYRNALQGRYTSKWDERPITSLARSDVHSMLDEIIDLGFPIQANKSLVYLNTFFGWCVERGILDHSPSANVKKPSKPNSRERALDPNEIAEVWAAFTAEGGVFGPMLKLMLLTGQRRDEVAGLRWDELKLDGESPVWELPGERTKNSLPNLVPLPPQAVFLLSNINRVSFHRGNRLEVSPFVFTTTGTTHVSGYSRTKARIDKWISQHRKAGGVDDPMPTWTFHDLRRTLATRMAEDLGIPPHIIEAVLNHISGSKAGVAGVYNRALYLNEKRNAVAAWANRIDVLTNKTSASNVVRLGEHHGQ